VTIWVQVYSPIAAIRTQIFTWQDSASQVRHITLDTGVDYCNRDAHAFTQSPRIVKTPPLNPPL
jgi:hypothetical protein